MTQVYTLEGLHIYDFLDISEEHVQVKQNHHKTNYEPQKVCIKSSRFSYFPAPSQTMEGLEK